MLVRGGSHTPCAQEQETLQLRQPPPEGGDSGRDDGVASPSQGRLNKPRSEDRETGYDIEVLLGHQTTSEEALGASGSAAVAAAPTMAPGASSREGNRLVRGGSDTPRAQEQETLQLLQPPPESGGSERDDGIARPSQGRLNKLRSKDRATGHDIEVVLGHQTTSSEEALGASESAAVAAAPPMAPGASSL